MTQEPLLNSAISALQKGQPVLLYDADGREEETDIVVPASAMTTDMVGTMRRDAGGLLCLAIGTPEHERLGLPFLSDLIQSQANAHPVLSGLLPHDIQYDASKPAFGLTINHRGTFTGITDEDRGLTFREVSKFFQGPIEAEDAVQAFGQAFRSPGHVPLLNGAAGGLDTRQGHTELSLALADLAGIPRAMALCEMMDDRTGRALSKEGAQAYAKAHGWVFLTGQEVLEAWKVRAPTSAS